MARKAPKEKADIKEEVIWSAPEVSQRNGKQVVQLRIVVWILDSVRKDPQFEKRQFFVTEDGKRKIGKTLGLKRDDMNFIIANWDDLGMYFNT